MLKVYDSATTFAEFPDEITLAVNISNCPGNCGHVDENGKFILDCSEPWLLADVGTLLTNEKIDELIKDHPGITVFGLMGGDSDQEDVVRIADYIHKYHKGIKVGMYSGREYMSDILLSCLDLYKIGRFIMPKGPVEEWHQTNSGVLQFPWSNQLLFEHKETPDGEAWVNVTYKFRKEKVGNPARYIIYNNEEDSN